MPTDDRALTYSTYLKIDELLGLQEPRSAGPEHDELLFIVVHQASELWFKVLLHEFDQLIAQLEQDDVQAAVFTMQRINSLVGLVAHELRALDTLPPQRFKQFRAIEATSGLRESHFMAALQEHGEIPAVVQRALARPTLQALFLEMLARRGVTLEALYTEPQHGLLLMLAEAFLEYEQGFAQWRFLHVQLVERIIGPMTGGTGGTLGAKYLNKTIQQRFFPELWAVRARLYAG